MCVFEAIAVGVVGGLETPDGQRYTSGEVAGMLSRLSFYEQALVRARRGSAQERALLKGWIWQRVAQEAAEKHWEIQRGARGCEVLADIAVAWMMDVKLSVKEMGRRFGLAETSFRRSEWYGRTLWALDVAEGLKTAVTRKLKLEIFG